MIYNGDKAIGYAKEDLPRVEVLALMTRFEKHNEYGGFEVKYEAGKVTFVKDWRGKKF